MILSKGLNKDGTREDTRWTMESDKETINKAAELINLFAGIPLDNIKRCLDTTAGQLAVAVLTEGIKEGEYKELTPMKMLVDELQEKLSAVESNTDFVSRQALVRELDDVLRAKSITPYRRQRINRAFKRECLECLGTGKAGRVISDTGSYNSNITPRKVKIGVSQTDGDCPTCKGTGAKPK